METVKLILQKRPGLWVWEEDKHLETPPAGLTAIHQLVDCSIGKCIGLQFYWVWKYIVYCNIKLYVETL